MAIVELFASLDLPSWAAIVLAAVVLVHLVPYVLDPHGIRAYPGPFWAKLTDLWLGKIAADGHRSERVHDLHKKYGPFVRLAPNHLSISDPAALAVVYGHGTGTLKSDFYDAFVSVQRGLFSTRSRPEHARKRKIVAHIFSQKSVLEFEPHVRENLSKLFRQWDMLCEGGAKGLSGNEGEGGWQGREGRVWYDCLPWYNYLAFDIIGDLAFGAPFGMLTSGKDSAPTAVSQADAMAAYGQGGTLKVKHVPAIQVINDRGEYAASVGVLPPHWRPFVKRLPWYNTGDKAVQNLAGMAIAAVARRMEESDSDRRDLLAKLRDARDEDGNPMGREELTAEALTQLIAGSDTTSNSSCAITYYLAKHQRVQEKLQQELDEALASEEDEVVPFERVKHLPYLEAVVNEALRIHSTAGVGLPRVVPAGGLEVCGKFFPEGTVLSVPGYTLHRDKAVWGDDADEFRPERWFGKDKAAMQRAFAPFSVGPRSCVGRNLAHLELLTFVASIFRRYSFVLENPDEPLPTNEGFLRKPLKCNVGMQRRNV
uniref:Cytochrome P450 monooxygenase n=1 Tax=Trametes versicolor TaxID=5325 RepID=A0AA86J497_TRAVE|nr:cytochrome P450 monooxygenase [Trametes versicolor]